MQLIAAPEPAESIGLASAVGLGVVPGDGSPEIQPSGDSGNWLKGYTLVGEICDPQSRYILNPRPCDDEGNLLENVPDTELFNGWEAGVPGYPVVLGAGVRCSTFSSPKDVNQWLAKADRRLELCQWSDLADELWTGAQSKLDDMGNRYLTEPGAIILAGTSGSPTAVSPTEAIALMDSSFGGCSCGGPRIIHSPTYLLAHFKHANVLERQGTRYFTPAGNLVVFDDGYAGTGPDTGTFENPVERAAPAAHTAWIYGTSPIVVKFDQVRHPGGTDWANYADYRTNDVVVRAERYAMASWLCCHTAVLVTTV